MRNQTHTKSHFETPGALSNDCKTLVDDARGLLEATSEIADEKIAAARQRLADAIEAGKETYENLQHRAMKGAKAVDKTVHDYPYQSMAVAFGVGALIGFLMTRRSSN